MKTTNKRNKFKRKAGKLKTEFENLYSDIVNQKTTIENSLLTDILKQYLNRNPTIEDFKKCEKHSREDVPDKYNFNYEKTLLGVVETSQSIESGKVGIKFKFLPLESIFINYG